VICGGGRNGKGRGFGGRGITGMFCGVDDICCMVVVMGREMLASADICSAGWSMGSTMAKIGDNIVGVGSGRLDGDWSLVAGEEVGFGIAGVGQECPNTLHFPHRDGFHSYSTVTVIGSADKGQSISKL
jgi:hypothetical protein